jgi:hypothetical protein
MWLGKTSVSYSEPIERIQVGKREGEHEYMPVKASVL